MVKKNSTATRKKKKKQTSKKSKTEQNEDVKGQTCDFQNKRELLRDPH